MTHPIELASSSSSFLASCYITLADGITTVVVVVAAAAVQQWQHSRLLLHLLLLLLPITGGAVLCSVVEL